MPATENKVVFTAEEQERCREAFMRFDRDRNGTIDAWELKTALESFGSKATDEEVFLLIAEVDMNANGVVDFSEFVKVLTLQKERQSAMSNEEDLSAYFLRGGGARANRNLARSPRFLPPPPHSRPRAPLRCPTVDAFIACGGQADLGGFVERDRLVKIVKEDFGLTLDIEKLINDFDKYQTGQLDYTGCVPRKGKEGRCPRARRLTPTPRHAPPFPHRRSFRALLTGEEPE